jgi:hypothetical protein
METVKWNMRLLLSCAALAFWAGPMLAEDQTRTFAEPLFSESSLSLWRGTNQTAFAKTNALEALRKLPRMSLPPQNSRTPPGPGIYETRPYTMIVMVPGKHADDKSLTGGWSGDSMPTGRPKLDFIPRGESRSFPPAAKDQGK